MDPKIIHLYEDYLHGGIDRRDFLRKLTPYAGSTAAALTLVSLLEENNATVSIHVNLMAMKTFSLKLLPIPENRVMLKPIYPDQKTIRNIRL